MTPETKGQPEPVAWAVMPTPSQDLDLWVVHREEEEAENEAAMWREADHEDVKARPLYDYDVPALLARQEKLVEALAKMLRTHRADYGKPNMVGEWLKARELSVEALAAAREET